MKLLYNNLFWEKTDDSLDINFILFGKNKIQTVKLYVTGVGAGDEVRSGTSTAHITG